MNHKSTNLILLTGAGFTKNFDGFLGSEMWSKIFNNPLIQANEKLRNILKDDYDYESVYSEVENNKILDVNDKQDFQQAVEDAYKILDDAVRAWTFNRDNPTALDIYKLFGSTGLLEGLFSSVGQNEGYIFTLNQDLLLERFKKHRVVGVPAFPDRFYQFDGKLEFEDNFFVTLSKDSVKLDIENSINSHSGIHYIKLHGSFGWKSCDGSNQMVLGKNKWEDIKKEPLLHEYFNLFNGIIAEGNKKILIIGYGFRDDHINKLLLEGIEQHGLKLFIITTMSPKKFDETLKEVNYTSLKEGLRGYFPYRLSEILPPNQAGSVHVDEIRKVLQE